jgi:WD40 repeat protein
VAYSPDGKTLAAGDRAGEVCLWNPAGKELYRFRLNGHTARGLQFLRDGKVLATAAESDWAHPTVPLQLWDLQSGEEQGNRPLRPAGGAVLMSFAFSPDGKTLSWALLRGQETTIELREAGTWKVRAALSPDQGYTGAVTFSPDGKLLTTAAGGDSLKLWRLEDLAR